MLELRTLGGLELRRTDGGAAGPLALQTKRLVLLAHLAAVPADSFRRRDSLLGLFWPELDQTHARGALRQALHTLRTALGEGVVVTRGEAEIGIANSTFRSDARDLELALQAGKPAEALALYRGEFLDGVFVAEASPELEEWIAGERDRLHRLAARTAWEVAEGAPGERELGEAVRRAVRLSGDDEPALRRGIELLDRQGDHAGAVALYEEFARRLARDLAVEPSRETRGAVDAIRARTKSGRATPRAPEPVIAPESPAVPPIPAPRIRRRMALAAALGIATLALLAPRAVHWSGRPEARDIVAVTPFRVSGADSSHAWLQEGMVDLLTIRLAGEGGVKVADPVQVLSSWRRIAPGGPGADEGAVARQVAADAGAESVVTGGVVGTVGRVTLSASLLGVKGGRTIARASAEGPADSLPALVDRLASQLLGGGAGLSEARLTSLTSSSLPAVREFLAGRAAAQRGLREVAVHHFLEALALDSNFTLAGLELLRAAQWVATPEAAELAQRRALAGRDRLSTADRILLDALVGEVPDAPALFRMWNEAVLAYPSRPETWYGLGDGYFHFGVAAGLPDAMARAEGAFHQGWRLDSAAAAAQGLGGPLVAEPIEHMIQLAHLRHDTAEVRRLSGLVLAADSAGYLAHLAKWHSAALGTATARDSFWASIEQAPQRTLMLASLYQGFTGEGLEDAQRVFEEDRRRLLIHDPGYADFAFTVYALNRGRPGEAPQGPAPPAARTPSARRTWLRWALWWEADSAGMGEVVRTLRAEVAKHPSTPMEARDRYLDLCALGLWQVTRGEYVAARASAAGLSGIRIIGLELADSMSVSNHLKLCAALIGASVADGLGAPDAKRKLAAADSMARSLVFALLPGSVPEANLQLARLWEAQGDLPRALEAARRRATLLIAAPVLLTSYVREEGRLAALTGDTAGAIRAYRHYLGLRYDPEPSLQPEVERVRRELARLEQK